MVDNLLASDFDYDLVEELIGQVPIEPRHDARLLVDRGPDEPVDHRRVLDLPDLLLPGDVVVVNDTKVLRARLNLRKATGGAVEVLLLEPTPEQRRWQALVRPGRRLRPGQQLFSGDDPEPCVIVGEALDDGRRLVDVLDPDLLDRAGQVPLPPYITAPLADPDRYQTIFARNAGSVAAPTAGLHLTDEVLTGLEKRGIGLERVELRVGLGTFRPLTTERIADHVMHAETYRVDADVIERLKAARADGGRVVAIGTTVVRTLESVAATGILEGGTELFINRGYPWQMVDVLLTNFHVPRSTLLVLVDAFIGPRWRSLYEEAIAERYRLLSFGDAMLLTRR